MNFDFLKDLTGLGHIYENCSNAERLAKDMPVQSVFTARKSAELLAKFIYLAAHNREVRMMKFADILADPVFQRFINSRQMLNAFQHIRITGNLAVHEDDLQSADDAIDVLQDLHYVTGETACILGLIENYPMFNEQIENQADAVYHEELDVEQKAQEMFLEYIEKYNAQIERDNYYRHRVDRLMAEVDELCSQVIFMPNRSDLNECLRFHHQPAMKSTIKQIQEHFAYIGLQAIKQANGMITDAHHKVEFSGKLTIYDAEGAPVFSTTDPYEFTYGLMHHLSDADGFEIISVYSGPVLYPGLNLDIREEFSTATIEAMGKQENFSYSVYEYYGGSGEQGCAKYENGHWVDLEESYTTDIVSKEYESSWDSYQLNLQIDFDFETYPDKIQAIHQIVKKHMPEDQYEYCLEFLEDEWEEGNLGMLIVGADWWPKSMREIQNYLDEVNEVIKPIMHECSGYCEGRWFITKPPLAVATWEWTDEGFRVVGTEF